MLDVDEQKDEPRVLRQRDITSQSEILKNAFSRIENIISDNKIEIIGRVFHGIPRKNTTVSMNTYYSDDRDAKITDVLHLGSYNYAGLNGHPEIIARSIAAVEKYGTTTSGVRLLNGTSEVHLELEKRLADFLQVDEVITFSSGFSANIAAFSSLCHEGDIVLSDMLNHQSITDGLKLSSCEVVSYRHASPKSIENILKKYPLQQRKFIVSDGVFSMDGDIAPLPEMVELSKKYNAYIIIDDAHGVASVGPNGRGTVASFGLSSEVDVITGSLSKGLPGIGGFIATNHKTAAIIRATANPYIFSASLPPGVAAGIIAAIDILEESPLLIDKLSRNVAFFTSELRSLGFNLLSSTTAIIPILMPDEDTTYEMARQLQENNIYANPVIYPAVSKSRPRIRLNLSADLTGDDMLSSIQILSELGKKLRVIS